MSKSSKPKKKQEASIKANINIDGNVPGSNIIVGHDNIINIEAIKTTYGLFTIPPPVTDFTGREAELVGLKASFTNGAIITGLSGAGGIGKTELAHKLAYDIANNYPDAQMNIDLLGTSEKPTSPEDAMRRLLEPFYVGEKLPDDKTQLKNLYQHTFGKKKVLLLLDNVANAAQVRPLIPPAPSAAIITSRQHFSLTEFGLHEPLRLDVLSPEKARVFLHGASPKLNDSPDEQVNELAKLCGHLPLALRVAASLLNDRSDWTANTLINRLQDEHTRLKRLKREGDYDVEATLNLSYELLDDDLKKHFRALGIFTAPFAKVSAQSVLEIEDKDELDEVLGKLLARSFLNNQKSQEIVEDLYFLHDLTRLYAVQKLLEEKEYEETLARHAEHFLEWAIYTDDLYQKGNKNLLEGLAQFRFIWVHLYSTYERLLPEQKKRPPAADYWLSDFPGRCVYVLGLHIPPQERIIIFQIALDAARRLGDEQAAGVHLANLGLAYADLGDAHKAIDFHEQALVIARKFGNRHSEGKSLSNLGLAYFNLGDARKAIELHKQALAIAREFGDRRGEGKDLGNLGLAYEDLGDAPKAIKFHKQALVIAREIGDQHFEGKNLGNLASAYAALGDAHKAIKFLEQSLAFERRFGDYIGEGGSLCDLGAVYTDMLDDSHKGIEFFEKALVIFQEFGQRDFESNALGNLGVANSNLGENRKAIEFLEQALVIHREIGNLRGEGLDLMNLGSVYKKLKKKTNAKKYWKKALEIFNTIESPHATTVEKSLADLE